MGEGESRRSEMRDPVECNLRGKLATGKNLKAKINQKTVYGVYVIDVRVVKKTTCFQGANVCGQRHLLRLL